MSYDGGIARHTTLTTQRYRALFTGVTVDVGNSVRYGSPVTGAPGQPVRTGNLLRGWQDQFVGAWLWVLKTNVEYARDVEDNVRGVAFRNHGPHSVALTVQGFPRLVSARLAEVRGA